MRVRGRLRMTAGIAVGANIDSLALNDTISSQLSSLSDMYGLYRFSHLKLLLMPGYQCNSASAPQSYGVGFTPEVLLTNPTTLVEACQMPFWAGQALYITTGSNVLMWGSSTPSGFTVTREELLSRVPLKWFRTQGKGTESDWETQGTFVFACTVAPATTQAQFSMFLDYECEFTDQLPLAVTRERLTLQAEKDIRQRLALMVVQGEPADNKDLTRADKDARDPAPTREARNQRESPAGGQESCSCTRCRDAAEASQHWPCKSGPGAG